MKSRHEQRAEATKRVIVEAAGALFAERGYERVTMREIAKEAGCSHTTIYLYFKDKEALLHHLSTHPLQELHAQMEAALNDPAPAPAERLRAMLRVFLRFCFAHRNMYDLLFMTRASRVDEQVPELAIQQQRNELFRLLQRAVGETLGRPVTEDERLACARVCFYILHGIVGTYRLSDESSDDLMLRLAPTFELAFDILLAGLPYTTLRGVDPQ